MNTQLVEWPLDEKNSHWVKTTLRQGAVGAFPTETCYGLGGNACLKKVALAVHNLKKRPLSKPLPTLLDNLQRAESWANITLPVRALINHYWPGALTLVLLASKEAPAHLVSPSGLIALRWSSHPVVSALTQLAQAPLIGTSANLSGQTPLACPTSIAAKLNPTWVIKSAVSPLATPSTVVDASQTRSGWQLLREGAIPAKDIESIWQSA